MKNLKEFKALIKRYESITLEEIEEKEVCSYISSSVVKELTGFGSDLTCPLCKAVKRKCSICVYGKKVSFFGCLYNENTKTYDRIESANTPLKLRNAFRARAKHMKTLI